MEQYLRNQPTIFKNIKKSKYSMKALLLSLTVLVLFISLSSAVDEVTPSYWVTQNQPYNLSVPCSFDADYCPADTLCKFTIIRLSDSAVLHNNQNGTLDEAVIYFPLTSTDNSINARYSTSVKCSSVSLAQTTSTDFYYQVTPTGDNRGLSWVTFLILASIILLALGLVVKSPYFGFISGGLLTYSAIYTVIYGFNNTTDLYTRATGFVLLGVGLFLVIIAGYEIVERLNIGGRESSEDDF